MGNLIKKIYLFKRTIKSKITIFNFIVIMTVVPILNCTSPQVRAQKNPFANFCPNYGFLKENEIPDTAKYINDAGITMVFYKSSGYGGPFHTEQDKLTKASEINSKKDLKEFMDRYSYECGKNYNAISPHMDKIKYVKREKEREQNSVLFNTVPNETVLDLRIPENEELFKNAWFNKFVSSSENNNYKGTQFEYETRKKEYEQVRNKKFLLAKSNMLTIDEYDFKKQCFSVDTISPGVPEIDVKKPIRDPEMPGGFNYVDLSGFPELDRICLPMAKNIAEDLDKLLKSKKIEWKFLWEIKQVLDSPVVENCNNYTYLYTKLACNTDGWKKVKLRRFKLKLLAFVGEDTDENFFIEGKLK